MDTILNGKINPFVKSTIKRHETAFCCPWQRFQITGCFIIAPVLSTFIPNIYGKHTQIWGQSQSRAYTRANFILRSNVSCNKIKRDGSFYRRQTTNAKPEEEEAKAATTRGSRDKASNENQSSSGNCCLRSTGED